MRHGFRSLVRYRLSTLLLAVTVFGVWLGVVCNKANRQKQAVRAIDEARGVIYFDYQRDAKGQRIPNAPPPGPVWLRKLIGDDYFRRVITVDFATEFFGRRKELGLSKVDDEGLRCFESLPDVEFIELGHNRAVTDQGLVHLRHLHMLETLYLYDCNVTGTGLAHLASLPNLKGLSLRKTPLTHEGVMQLCKIQTLEWLDLAGTPITDDELVLLSAMSRLPHLIVPATISDDGLREIRRALPNCDVSRAELESPPSP